MSELRQSTCTLDNAEVDKVVPGRRDNPANVRTVEQLLPAAQFAALFPRAAAAYTYTNLLKAVAKFPSVCPEPGLCRKTLATVFAHFEQETAGLVYLEVTDYKRCLTRSRILESPHCHCHRVIEKAASLFSTSCHHLSWGL